MSYQNRNEKTISEVYRIEGTGKVMLANGDVTDVEVVGIILKGRWWFIIHRDVLEPQYFTISEASCGYKLNKDTYVEFEDALYFGLPFIDEKYYYLHTAVMGHLVKTQKNLIKNNLSPQTLAINTALWL